ncbi:MAG TPA: class I SAM-dependent methyltransferase [Vicinamibacterales bacterium]|nr:class I SAM-dependent methyltransferase [Vicinamibacterales bacterium]
MATASPMLKRWADNRDPASLAARLRRRRFALFESLLSRVPGHVRILDVGGTPDFWRVIGLSRPNVSVTLLNRTAAAADSGPIHSVVGDARDMREFADGQFDVVFSNSVIEHLGTYRDQQAMASEVRRIGTRYFVQTPNRHFPIEPHFLLPGFQFLPVSLRAGLLARRDVGWYKRADTYEAALKEVTAIRLLSGTEFRRLFPEGRLYKERLFGLTKSFTIYHGWDWRPADVFGASANR